MKINPKTNISFFLVLLGVLILAFIEGSALNKILGNEGYIYGGEIQLIAFILITIFMIAVSTLRPNKMVLVSYSSMTLGLIVIVTGLFDQSNSAPLSIKATQVIIGLILLISGFIMSKELKFGQDEMEIVKRGLKNYKKL